ncbi:MAG: Tad domain-containing protein [Candidatus Wallbacteria bacterium]|nr:Tad domain-containing protein [Candidatus Wallbacteria bacterium]
MKIKPGSLNKKGVSIVIVALSSVVIMGMAALAVDVGNAYMQKSTLDQAAQLAALSAAQAMKNSNDQAVIQQKALDVFAQNGLPVDQAHMTVNVTKGTETAFIDAHLTVPFYFARVLGFSDVTLNSQALAELCADGSAKLIKENTYDLVPWGIPHGKTTYNFNEQKLYIDGTLADNWSENSGFAFNPGSEYLLKLGEGPLPDQQGRKYLIPMDGGEDANPKDAVDPICPEVGSHSQSQLLKAYGLVHWCLQQHYAVDWLLDYNGGSYLVDYHSGIDTAVSSNGVSFSSVNKILLTAAQARQLTDFLAANQNSENRSYTVVHMTRPINYAVFTPFEYSCGDLMPWGLQYKTNTYPFGYQFGAQYTLKYGSGAGETGYGGGNWGALAMGANGANQYRDNIEYGVDDILHGVENPNGTVYYVGRTIDTEPGNMVGPTMQGLTDRITQNKLYVKIPVVTTLDVNGRSATTIMGFLNFKLNSVDSQKGWVYGTLVDKIPVDQLTHTVNENENEVVPAKVLKMAGIPYNWIHDDGVLNGTINNYQWISTSHDDFYDENVAEKIAEWNAGGRYFFNLCWSTLRFENALCVYNHRNFGTETQNYIPGAFFQTYSEPQYSHCYRCNASGANCDACRYTGWVIEYVKHDDINNESVANYTLSPHDISLNQDHVATVNADPSSGRVQAFNVNKLLSDCQVFAKNNSAAGYNQVITAYSSSSVAKVVSRTYKIHNTDLGGVMTFMGGHDPGNDAGYRLILNSCLAGTQTALLTTVARTNYGALDMDAALEAGDPDEYLANIKYGYKYLLTPGQVVDTLPGNFPEQTNTGVAFNMGTDAGTWNSHATDSQRIVLVPIVSTKNSDNALICTSTDNVAHPPAGIYSIYQRDKVRLKGIAKFWLLDVTQLNSYDATLGPLENGQVRGIFLGYYIPPADAK